MTIYSVADYNPQQDHYPLCEITPDIEAEFPKTKTYHAMSKCLFCGGRGKGILGNLCPYCRGTGY